MLTYELEFPLFNINIYINSNISSLCDFDLNMGAPELLSTVGLLNVHSVQRCLKKVVAISSLKLGYSYLDMFFQNY